MRKLSLVLVMVATLVVSAVETGRGMGSRTAAPNCPNCKVQLVRHRFSRAGNRRGHVHVKYVCPSCRKEWQAAPDGTEREVWVCPKCGCELKECPSCCKTFKK